MRDAIYIGYLWLVPHSHCACIPPEQSQWSDVLSALSLIPPSTRLYKWGPCSYQGYQFVWNIRPVRVRAMILSSPRLPVTLLLLLYFTHAFHSCAFISFPSRWADTHNQSAEEENEMSEIDVILRWQKFMLRRVYVRWGCRYRVQTDRRRTQMKR